MTQLVHGIGALEFDANLTRAARVVWCYRSQIPEGAASSVLDEPARPQRGDITRTVDPEAGFDGNRGEAGAEQLRSFAAGGVVSGHQQHRTRPGPAQGSVDAGLADEGCR